MTVQQDEARVDAAIADPSRQFRFPMDVVRDNRLDLPTKRTILESWRKDAELLLTATNENMAGGEAGGPTLRDINLALDQLEGGEAGASNN